MKQTSEEENTHHFLIIPFQMETRGGLKQFSSFRAHYQKGLRGVLCYCASEQINILQGSYRNEAAPLSYDYKTELQISTIFTQM